MAPPRRKNIFRLAPPPPMTIYVRRGFLRVLTEEFAALKVKRAALVEDKMEAHSQGDLRENFGFKAAKDAIRAVDRKMDDLDRFYRRNTFVEVDPAAWLTKPTDFVQLGHVIKIEKEDIGPAAPKRKHRFKFLVATYGETATDAESEIECLPHASPLATALLGLEVGKPAQVQLPAGPAVLTVLAIRNPTEAELERLLAPIKAPEMEDADEGS
jgi:transcription elongation factor GreA